MSVSTDVLLKYPLVIFLIIIISKSIKIVASYLLGRKELGEKESILLGVGLSVRFSTTIIIMNILFQEGLIGIDLYSVIITSSVIFNFIVPFLFSKLLVKWKIVNSKSVYNIFKLDI